jgi:hypothetical protein
MNYGDDRYQPYGSFNQQYDTRCKKQKPKKFENSEGHLQDGEVDNQLSFRGFDRQWTPNHEDAQDTKGNHQNKTFPQQSYDQK